MSKSDRLVWLIIIGAAVILAAAFFSGRTQANEIVYCKNIQTGEITVHENYCPSDSFPIGSDEEEEE